MVVVKVDINTLKSDFPKFKKDLLNLNEYMYKNPELGYQEFESVQKITSLITKNVPNAKFKSYTDKCLRSTCLLHGRHLM